jgi:hypothetical protein
LSSEKIKLGFGQIQDALGEALAPAFEKFVTFFIEQVVPPLTKFFEEDFPALIAKFQPVVEGVIAFFSEVGEKLKEFLDIDEETSLLEGILEKISALGENPQFITFLGTMGGLFSDLAPVLRDIVFNVAELAVKLSPLLTGTLATVIPIVSDFARILGVIDYFLGEILGLFGEFEGEAPSFLTVLDNLLNPLSRVERAVRGIADAFVAAMAAFERFKASGGSNLLKVSGGGTAIFGGERANGGRVTGGMPYLVGEMGPELFMPGRGGNIVPNDMLGRGGGSNITINVNAGMGTDGARVGEQIVNAIKRYERSSGPVFAKA